MTGVESRLVDPGAARRLIDHLCDKLAAADPGGDASLGSGAAGLALAAGHLASARGDEQLAARAGDWIAGAVEQMVERVPAPGLAHGIAGVGFALEQLGWLGVIEEAEPVALLLADVARRQLEIDDLTHDLLLGAAGIAIHGTQRASTGRDARLAASSVAHLARAAHREGGLAWWINRPDPRWVDPSLVARFPAGYADAGMAHGIAGALAALAAAAGAGVEAARPLCAEVAAWLAAPPPFVPLLAGQPEAGWCRGEVGVAAGLYAAARAGDDEALADAAVDRARRALGRAAWQPGSLALCHGAAGVAHIAHRLHRATGDPAFADAARAAFAAVLAGADAITEPGLLDGAAGMALAVDAALDPTRASWDRWFLPGLP